MYFQTGYKNQDSHVSCHKKYILIRKKKANRLKVKIYTVQTICIKTLFGYINMKQNVKTKVITKDKEECFMNIKGMIQ